MWPRISKNQKKDGKGQLQLGCFSLLVAHGRGSRVGHKLEWARLACWPAHPWGGKRASTWAPGAAVGPRREEAQDLKKRRPSAFSLLVLGGLGQRLSCAAVATTWGSRLGGCYSVDTVSVGRG